MPIKSLMATMSVLGLLTVAGTANAGDCAGPDCRLDISYIQGTPAQFGPMTVQDNHPMGHLRTVNFQRAPHVSIMRVHGLPQNVGISDAPVAFTGGCHPQSTEYCRQDVGAPQQAAPTPQPASITPQAPVYSGQVSIPTTYNYSSQAVDYSLFQSRQYGDNRFVPGIAHVPTSFVDRSPENADRALNSGRAVAQPIANGGVAPRPSMMGGMIGREYSTQVSIPTTYAYRGQAAYTGQTPSALRSQHVGIPETYAARPMPHPTMAPYPPMAPMVAPNYGGPVMAGAPVLQNNGTYGSTVGADGTYWEKASGPAVFGDTLATQVICKRQVQTRVANPVVGVPVPTCNTAQPHPQHQGHGYQNQQSRYEHSQSGWTY